MVDLTFDNGTVERFTLVLSQRDYTHLGQISNTKGIKFKGNLNAADELAFEVCKELDGHEEILWDDIYDLRLVWVRELDEYFEIDVESTDTVNITKYITGKSLCESELSQTGLHDIEINTADDIAREDYDPNYPTVFYRPLNNLDPDSEEYKKKKNSSLLHRIMDKVPAYKIGHVDETLMNLQRIFSISDTTLYDFMVGECSEQFNCLFQFDSATRTISAYDLKTTCHNNHCPYYVNENHEYYSGDKHYKYRGLFNDRCPICGSTNITSFGEDTTVFVSTENLTDEVKFDTDVASLKNCFRLEAGDDNMTAAVINSNPNGTRYIYEFNNDSKKDMPEELVTLIDNYDDLYNEYNNIRDMELDTSLIDAFNALCAKYDNDQDYHKGDEWKPITLPVYGYKNLIPHYYNCIDFYQYLKSSLMPVVSIEKTTVEQEKQKLIDALINDRLVGVSTTPKVVATVTSAVQNLCKLYVNTGLVKVKAESDTWDPDNWQSWDGTITLTSFEDDTDKAIIHIPEDTFGSLTITLDFATFMDQKISKYIKRSKESVELYDILKIKDLNTFKDQLKYYSSARLQSFHDALAAVIGILAEADQGHDGFEKRVFSTGETANPHEEGLYEKNAVDQFQYDLTADTEVVEGKEYYEKSTTVLKSLLYDDFYKEYYLKLQAAEEELNLRNQEIEIVYGTQDSNGNILTKGVLQYIMDSIIKVQQALNFKQYIYNNTDPNSYDLYNVYTTYIREDTYSNSNYISDDLNNDQLFENAGKFLEIAKDELHKSATYQHSITSNLNNLMAIDEFKPLLDKFNLGNWIRIQEDERVYRLRLISYSIDFDNLSKLDTEFSDVTITADGMNDVMSVIKQASSMASSYSYTQQQAETGSKVQTNYIDNWLENGLSSALIRINNNDDEDISIDNTGILARSYDDVSETHDPEQLRITHNVIAFTDDNWQSVKTSLGKFSMTHHYVNSDGLNLNKNAISRYDEYGLVANAVLSGWVVGSYIEGGNIIASHYQTPGNESYIDMSDDVKTDGKKMFIKLEDAFTVDKNGNAKVKGEITATSGKIGNWTLMPITSDYFYGAGALYYKDKDSDIMGYDPYTAILSPKGCYMKPGANQTRFGWKANSATDEETFILGVGQYFGVNNEGKLYAKNINVSGEIIAESGQIGAWHIDPLSSNPDDYEVGSGALYYNAENPTNTYLLAPNGTKNNYGLSNSSITARKWNIRFGNNFGIDTNGNAFLCGNIYANAGKIGVWEIDTDSAHNLKARVGSYDGASQYSWLAPNYIHLVNLTGGSWKEFVVNPENQFISIAGSDPYIYVSNKAAKNHSSKPGGTYIRISPHNIYRTNGDTTVVWHSELNESDIRLKEKVEELSLCQSLEFINSLIPKQYKFKKADGIRYGFIAQDVENVLDNNYGIVYEESDGYKHLNYIDIIAPLVKIVQEQQKQINCLMRLKGENNG